jgi:hypothetical protein
MKILKKIMKGVFVYVVGIIAFGNFFFNNKFTLSNIIAGLKTFQIEVVSQTFILIGFSILLSVSVSKLLKIVFKIKKPTRDGFDLVAEVLLPEDQLTNSESIHGKRLFKYNVINLTFALTLIGVFLIILYKYFNVV